MPARVHVEAPEERPEQATQPATTPAPARAPRSPDQVLALQRGAGNAAVGRMLVQRLLVDQHAGAEAPDAAQIGQIEGELNPTAPPVAGKAAPKWDGDPAENPASFHIQRAVLATELVAALSNHLNGVMPTIKKESTAPALPMSSFEGAGRAAKRVTDDKFGSLTSAAALTGPQQHARGSFSFKAGTNLLDIRDKAVYTPNAEDVSDWIAQTDPAASAASKKHNFNKDRSTLERDWLFDTVIKPFASGRRADLELYDVYGFAMAPTESTVIVAPVLNKPGFSNTAPATGGPSPAERKARWDMWALLVHEYIHTLEHPALKAARKSNRIISEGFCEMFTEEVLIDWIPKAQADTDPALRGDVEGTDPGGKPWTGFDKGFVAGYSAGSYAEYAKHAKNIRNILGASGETEVKAAFFQGHVEFIGLKPGGGMASAPAHGSGQVEVPSGASGWGDLETITGVPAAELEHANPLVFTPVPGEWIWAGGTRYHVVVQATGRSVAPAGGTVSAVETIDQIGTQNGVTPADLKKANPGMDFTKLKAGDRVLVPRH